MASAVLSKCRREKVEPLEGETRVVSCEETKREVMLFILIAVGSQGEPR